MNANSKFGHLGSTLTVSLVLIGIGVLIILSGRHMTKGNAPPPSPTPPEENHTNTD